MRLRAPLVLLASLTTLLATAPSAAAHDQLRSTNPADGAVLDVAPAQIDLTFSDDVLPISPQVVLRDTAQNDVTTTEPSVSGDVVSLPWPTGTAGGDFTVAWRVVSSDGHPIEGQFAFTVTAPTEAPAETPGETAVETPAAPTTQTTTAVAGTTDQGSSPTPFVMAGVAAAALLLVTLLLVRRTRPTPKDPS